jgi:LEA14-like dessication related protein
MAADCAGGALARAARSAALAAAATARGSAGASIIAHGLRQMAIDRFAGARCVLALVLALPLAACALFAPKFTAPQLSIVGVELQQGDVWKQQLKVRMHVHNPNDRALPVTGLSYRLEVAGEDFARGEAASQFSVPALGDTEFDMNVTANIAGVLFKLLGRRDGASADAIEYRIVGKVSFGSALVRSLPFEQRGTFKLR